MSKKYSINPLEISTTNYYIRRFQNKSIKDSENLISSNNDVNKTTYYKRSYPLRVSLPLKGIKGLIKSTKYINTERKSINRGKYLSPNTKVKISYLNHFNNNSIYYSNQKKIESNFKNTQLNTEIKTNKRRLLFEKENKNNSFHLKNIINLQKTQNQIYKKQIKEDSKNNDSISCKKQNYISSYNFLTTYDSQIIINKQILQTKKNKKLQRKNY